MATVTKKKKAVPVFESRPLLCASCWRVYPEGLAIICDGCAAKRREQCDARQAELDAAFDADPNPEKVRSLVHDPAQSRPCWCGWEA